MTPDELTLLLTATSNALQASANENTKIYVDEYAITSGKPTKNVTLIHDTGKSRLFGHLHIDYQSGRYFWGGFWKQGERNGEIKGHQLPMSCRNVAQQTLDNIRSYIASIPSAYVLLDREWQRILSHKLEPIELWPNQKFDTQTYSSNVSGFRVSLGTNAPGVVFDQRRPLQSVKLYGANVYSKGNAAIYQTHGNHFNSTSIKDYEVVISKIMRLYVKRFQTNTQ